MNDYVASFLKSIVLLSSDIFAVVGKNVIDDFSVFFTGVIGIVIIVKALIGMFGNSTQPPKEIVVIIVGLIIVYLFFVSFANYKYWVFDTILGFPWEMSSYFSDIKILGVNLSDGESITQTIWILIEKRIFSVFQHISLLAIFKSLWLIICSLLAAIFLFILWFNYWALSFLFAIEITILSIIGIVVCFAAPFKEFRPVFINWVKAMVGSTLPIVMMSLILLFLKVLIISQSNDLSKAVGINDNVVIISVQKIAFTAGMTVLLAKKISEWISIILGFQSNSSSLTNPFRSANNAIGRVSSVGKGVGIAAVGAIGAAKIGNKMADLGVKASSQAFKSASASLGGIKHGVIGGLLGKGVSSVKDKFASLQGKK